MPIGDSKFKELPETVNELIADRAIRHALYLERYKTQVVNEILTEFNRTLAPELIIKIEKSLERITLKSKNMQILFKDNGDLIREEYKVMEAKLYEQLRDFSKVESAWLIQTMQNVMPIAYDFVSPSAVMLKSLVTNQPMEGALVKDWFAYRAKTTAFDVNRAIQNGIINGKGIADIVRSIKGTQAENYKDGILNAPRRHLEAIVRTSVKNVSDAARDETYAANSDVVKGVQWISTLDSRTCLTCMNLDGKVFDIGDKPGVPHLGCRCSDAPVLKSWKELGIAGLKELPPGTRASSAITKAEKKRIRKLPKDEKAEIMSKLNGQVPATTTYPAWLKKQTAEVQNEALGIKRAQLFRSGQLKLNEFIDRRNKPLTLKELEKLAG